MAFLSAFKRMEGSYLDSGHGCYCPHHLQFTK